MMTSDREAFEAWWATNRLTTPHTKKEAAKIWHTALAHAREGAEVVAWQWEAFNGGVWEPCHATRKPDLKSWPRPTRNLRPLYTQLQPDASISPPAESGEVEPVTEDALVLEWRNGAPPKPWSEEWFIAQTTYGDRVVLRALPEEYSYDFKTADETYIKRDKIAKWMQFPDSEYIAPFSKSGDVERLTVLIGKYLGDHDEADARGIAEAVLASHTTAPQAGGAVKEEDFLHMRERVAAVREYHRRKMNGAADRAEMAASVGAMQEVSINSTESERHREAFVALNVAIGIIDQTEYSALESSPSGWDAWAEEKLKALADELCEGWCKENGGEGKFDDCLGCRILSALPPPYPACRGGGAMSKTDSHNALAGIFVRNVLAEVIRTDGDDAAVMVVAESTLLGAVLACEKIFGVSRRTSVERLNSLVQAVEERLSGSDLTHPAGEG